MADCKECGSTLRYIFEVKENKGLCSGCGPGSIKWQEANGESPARERTRSGIHKTRADVIINHLDGNIEKLDINTQPGKGVTTIPSSVGVMPGFVETVAPEKIEPEKSNSIYDNARELINKQRNEIEALKVQLADKAFNEAADKAFNEVTADNEAVADLKQQIKAHKVTTPKKGDNDVGSENQGFRRAETAGSEIVDVKEGE